MNGLVNERSIHVNIDRVTFYHTLNPIPFAYRIIHIRGASEAERVLPLGVPPIPVHAPTINGYQFSSFLINGCFPVPFCSNGTCDGKPIGSVADHDEIANATFNDIAFDGIHPSSPCP